MMLIMKIRTTAIVIIVIHLTCQPIIILVMRDVYHMIVIHTHAPRIMENAVVVMKIIMVNM